MTFLYRQYFSPDTESFQLFLDETFVLQRLQHVQHDEDEGTGSGNGDNLKVGSN